MCVKSRTPGFSFCHGNTFDPVYRAAAKIQKKEAMPVRRNSDHNCIAPGPIDLAYRLQIHVCMDALQLWSDDHQHIGFCGLAYIPKNLMQKNSHA